MPDTAEIHPLVLQFHDRNDLRVLVQAFKERVFDHLAKIRCEPQKLCRREVLTMEEYHQEFEPDLPNRSNVLSEEVLGKVDSGNNRAQ